MFRMYVRNLLIFEFKDPRYLEDAARALQAGFAATIREIPILAGKIRLSDPQAGEIALQYPEDISDELIKELFTVSDGELNSPDLEYATMEKAGFPPVSTWREYFCPKILRSHPGLDDEYATGPISFQKGQAVPALAAQATFIRGGLVLSVYSHHSVIDGSGIAKVYKSWSEHTKKQNLTPSARSPERPKTLHTDLDAQRQLIDKIAATSNTVECPEVRFPGAPRSAPPLRPEPYELASKIFVFPEATINNLVQTLTSKLSRRVSNFVALVSLVWANVTIVRSDTLTGNEIRNIKLGMAFDHRRSFGQEFKDSYLGNCVTEVQASCDVSRMISRVSEDSMSGEQLAPVALAILTKLDSIDLDWLKPRLKLFSQTPNSWQLRADADEKNGPDLFVTSWMHIGTNCTWGIPGTTTEGPVAIRKPQAHIEGTIHILPKVRIENGASVFEVSLCLEKGEMERLVSRLEGEKWVVRAIDA